MRMMPRLEALARYKFSESCSKVSTSYTPMALSTSESGRAPAPSRRGSRGVYVEDFHTVAVTLRTIGDAIPIFGGVLKATAGLAVAILDASEVSIVKSSCPIHDLTFRISCAGRQRVSIAREMSKNLAVRAAQLVVVILQEAAAGDLPVDTLDQRYHPFIVSVCSLCLRDLAS